MVRRLGARAHTLLPTVQGSGQPVNARGACSFCSCSGEVLQGLEVAVQSGRPERARPCARSHAAAAVTAAGWAALTATQDGVTPQTEVYKLFYRYANSVTFQSTLDLDLADFFLH